MNFRILVSPIAEHEFADDEMESRIEDFLQHNIVPMTIITKKDNFLMDELTKALGLELKYVLLMIEHNEEYMA